MADQLLNVNASAGQAVSIGATRAGQQIQQAVIARLLGSIEQTGQAASAARSPDRVQISQEAYQRLAAEGAGAG